MVKDKLSQKEKNIFFAGLSAGIVGGIISNFFVSSFYDLLQISKQDLWIRYALFFIFGLTFIGVIYWINKQIKKSR